MIERDLDKRPYSSDEKRIAEFFFERGLGGGDDPVGFILSSYAYVVADRQMLMKALEEIIDADTVISDGGKIHDHGTCATIAIQGLRRRAGREKDPS